MVSREPANSSAPDKMTVARLLRPLIRIVLISYLGAIIVLLAFENALVYRPVKASADWMAPPSSEVRELFLGNGEQRIHAWYWPKPGKSDVLLYCHGNAGNLSHRGQAMAGLRELLDTSVLIFDYPGYGKSDGRPSEAGCYQAAHAAYDWLLAEEKIDPERILIYGDSLGGGVAVELAHRRPHRALVVVNSFTSAPDVARRLYPWLPVHFLMRNRFNNLDKIDKCDRPVFIAHGTADSLIPFQHGQKLFEAASEPKYFFSMPGMGHNDPLPRRLFDKVREFLNGVECGK